LYISKEVGCGTLVQGTLVPNPPLTRNCDREDFIIYGHYLAAFTGQPNGKADEKIALKPGDFGMLQPLVALTPYGVKHFFLSFEEELEKSRFYHSNTILSSVK
jgi:hypothetical protein